MNTSELIQNLEAAWDTGGFLELVRRGTYEEPAGKAFLSLLRSISIDDSDLVPKRLLSLLWYLPSFLEWQKERVADVGSDAEAYSRFVTEVHNILEDVLGFP
jgi:hypothetical protein